MAPIFKLGYYPGDRPLRKKRRYSAPPTIDPITGMVLEAVSFDHAALGLPQTFGKFLEADFEKGFAYRYTGLKRKSGVTNKLDELIEKAYKAGREVDPNDPNVTSAIQEELNQLPGAKGIGFNVQKLLESNSPEEISQFFEKTGNEWVEAVLGFKDLSSRSEIAGIWDPLLNPNVNGTEAQRMMSLSSAGFIKRFQEMDPDREYKLKDLKSADRFADSVRNYVLSGSSLTPGDDAFVNLQISYFQALKDAVKFNPHYLDAVDGITEAREQIDSIVQNTLRLQSEAAAETNPVAKRALYDQITALGTTRSELEGRVITLENSIKSSNDLIERVDGVLGQKEIKNFHDPTENRKVWAVAKGKEKEFKALWKELQESDSATTQALLGQEERTMVAWSRLVDYRHRVFRYNEFIDKVAEGKMLQAFAYSPAKYFLKKYTRGVVDLNAMYMVKRFMERPEDVILRALVQGVQIPFHKVPGLKLIFKKSFVLRIPFVKGLTDFSGMMLDKVLGRVAGWTAKSFAGVLNGLGGGVARGAITKLSTWLFGAAAGTGVGLAPALIAAALQYVGEKVWDILKSALTGDFDAIFKKVTEEVARLIVACSSVVTLAFASFALVIYMAISFVFAPLLGLKVQNYDSLGGGISGIDDVTPPELKSQYIDVQKAASVSRLENSQLIPPFRIRYEIDIAATTSDLVNIKAVDTFTTSPDCVVPTRPEVTRPSLSAGQSFTIEYDVFVGEGCEDSIVINRVVVTADVVTGNLRGEASSASDSVFIGTPPTGCYEFVDFSPSELAASLEAAAIMSSNKNFMARLCAGMRSKFGVSTLKVVRQMSLAECGYAPWDKIYYGGNCSSSYFSNKNIALYMLAHETAHIWDHIYGEGAFNPEAWGEPYMPTYCLTSKITEDFAETIANYIYGTRGTEICASSQPGYDTRPYDMRREAPKHYNFAKTIVN